MPNKDRIGEPDDRYAERGGYARDSEPQDRTISVHLSFSENLQVGLEEQSYEATAEDKRHAKTTKVLVLNTAPHPGGGQEAHGDARYTAGGPSDCLRCHKAVLGVDSDDHDTQDSEVCK